MQVLAVQGVAHVGNSAFNPPKHFGGQHIILATPTELFDDATHDGFALSTGIGLGVIKEVATSVPSVLHAIHRHVVIELRVEGDPTTKRQNRNFEATTTEAAIFHFWIGSKCGGSVHAPHPTTSSARQ